MRVRFLAPARRELMRSAIWYDDRSPGLGDRLLEDVRRRLRDMLDFPLAHPPIDRHYRRCLLASFPFALVYRIDVDRTELVIVAVARTSRKPDFWRRRDQSR